MGIPPAAGPRLEMWGGIECTVNRVGEAYLDQLEASGHDRRRDDLDLIASLGIFTLRYPLLWERIQPGRPEEARWEWADSRMAALRALRLRPIVGLVHHGSGPRHTSLIDPGFPEALAAYARAVAVRYPWLEMFTPINEPMTTARFSGLYGHWYPHGRDDRTFVRALLTECRAVVLAMLAIRTVIPDARLVQTDDLGKTLSTPRLAYQADFDNERRFLSWDLLCGRVDRRHPLWSYLRSSGAEERELAWLHDHPCPPDLIGVNYYLTSERFLDHAVERYPVCAHGGNGRHRYADVEMVRVRAEGLFGPAAVLREAWERYRLPLAVTEAHLGCTREEQLRWLHEVWTAARDLQAQGVDIRAVTVWSLLGAYNWDSLVTQQRGHYEPGVFDLRGGKLRPTALATLVRELAAGRDPSHPVVAAPGWWRRPERLLYPPRSTTAQRAGSVSDGFSSVAHASGSSVALPSGCRPILIVGTSAPLGDALVRLCTERGLAFRRLDLQHRGSDERATVAAAFEESNPWAVVNATRCERGTDACHWANTSLPALLARACACRRLPLLTFSSDLVFDGRQRSPYRESDPAAPIHPCGLRMAEGEQIVLGVWPAALVVRSGVRFGPWDERNFVAVAHQVLAAGETLAVPDDPVFSVSYLPDLVHTALDLLLDGAHGIWHLANPGTLTWVELARAVARLAGQDLTRVREEPAARFRWAARRPPYSALTSERAVLLPSWEDALERYGHAGPTLVPVKKQASVP